MKKFKFFSILFAITIFSSNYFAAPVNIDEMKKDILNYSSKYNVGFYYENTNISKKLSLNENKLYEPASTNKTPLALYFCDNIRNGTFNQNQKVAYKKSHFCDESESITKFKFGTEFTIINLLEKLIRESNDSAYRMLKSLVEVSENKIKTDKKIIEYLKSDLDTPKNNQKLLSYCSFTPKELVTHMKKLHEKVVLNENKDEICKKMVKFYSSGLHNEQIPEELLSNKDLKLLHKPGWFLKKKLGPNTWAYTDEMIIYNKKTNDHFYLSIMSLGIPPEKRQNFFKDLIRKIFNYNNALAGINK